LEHLKYPRALNAVIRSCREGMKFDYKKLFKENLIPLKPQNEFKVIERIKIDAVQYDYCGQIDKTT